MSLTVILYVIWIVSAITCLMYYFDNSRTPKKPATWFQYMASSLFIIFVPVLNTAAMVRIIYFMIRKRYLLRVFKKMADEPLDSHIKRNDEQRKKYIKEASSRMFDRDPEFWFKIHDVNYIEGKTHEEYWREIHGYPYSEVRI